MRFSGRTRIFITPVEDVLLSAAAAAPVPTCAPVSAGGTISVGEFSTAPRGRLLLTLLVDDVRV